MQRHLEKFLEGLAPGSTRVFQNIKQQKWHIRSLDRIPIPTRASISKGLGRLFQGLKIAFWCAVTLSVIAAVLAALPELFSAAKDGLSDFAANECAKRWQQSGLHTKWEYGVGCLVNVDERWVRETHVQVQPKNAR